MMVPTSAHPTSNARPKRRRHRPPRPRDPLLMSNPDPSDVIDLVSAQGAGDEIAVRLFAAGPWHAHGDGPLELRARRQDCVASTNGSER